MDLITQSKINSRDIDILRRFIISTPICDLDSTLNGYLGPDFLNNEQCNHTIWSNIIRKLHYCSTAEYTTIKSILSNDKIPLISNPELFGAILTDFSGHASDTNKEIAFILNKRIKTPINDINSTLIKQIKSTHYRKDISLDLINVLTDSFANFGFDYKNIYYQLLVQKIKFGSTFQHSDLSVPIEIDFLQKEILPAVNQLYSIDPKQTKKLTSISLIDKKQTELWQSFIKKYLIKLKLTPKTHLNQKTSKHKI